MSVPLLPIDDPSIPECSEVEFGLSADGFPVARIGDLVFAMLPARNSKPSLASAWRLTKSLIETRRDDFYARHGSIEDETAFRSRMIEQAEHSRELKTLDRQARRIPCSTPWGPSQGATVYADGVVAHTTASHGGFHLSVDRNALVDLVLRVESGFYEEDAAWAIVAITFPRLFTAYERDSAEKTVKDGWPDEWEAISGKTLAAGESETKDRRSFAEKHARDWVVTSALISDHQPGMTEVIATVGGSRDVRAEERRFLVPSNEYMVGRFGFVIDQDRHDFYEGPSNFASWQTRSTGS